MFFSLGSNIVLAVFFCLLATHQQAATICSISGPDGYTWSGFTSGSSKNAGVIISGLTPGEYVATEVSSLPVGWVNTDTGSCPPCENGVIITCERNTAVKFGNW